MLTFWPGLAIFLVVLGFKLLGDGIREGETPPIELDDVDRQILEALHDNAGMSYTELDMRISLSRVAVQNRIQALREAGVIERFTVVINPAKVGTQVSAFFNVDIEPAF